MTGTMKRFVLTGPGEYHYDTAPIPGIEKDTDVQTKILAAGICGTDVHIFHGRRAQEFPFVIGHEYVGIVTAVGPAVTKVKVGDYVTGEANYSCGVCQQCATGHGNLCVDKKIVGITVPGVFQEYTVVPERYVWKIPESISPREGAAIEAGVVGFHAVNRANVHAADRVLIFGAGSVGLWALQCARVQGGRVFVSDVNKERLAIAKELGAEEVFYTGDIPVDEKFDIIIDAAGAPITIQQSISLCRDNGTIVFVGICAEPVEIDMCQVTRHELNLHGAVASNAEYPAFIQLLSTGQISGEKISTHVLPFEEIPKAIDLMAKQIAIKAVIDFSTK
jgi:L-gulonate 5-dehydrogenase